MQASTDGTSMTPTLFVLFGGTGDLARKKLFPSLMDLYAAGYLPETCRIVGFSRRDFSDTDYRSFMRDVIARKGHTHGKEDVEAFLTSVSYVRGSFDDPDSYQKLRERLEQLDEEIGQCTNKLLYLAVPPRFYDTIFDNLATSKLSEPCSDKTGLPAAARAGWTRVLVEKPFGKDIYTAQELDAKLCSVFREEQIFRIDHYLAKDAVQNILTFRFSNVLLEHAWNREHIGKVHIKLSENFGVEERAAFYDGMGALRDVGQNHMLQMLALVTMENPGALSADRLRAERARVFEHLRVYSEQDLPAHVVRGQYESYRAHEGVAEGSETETYFLLKAFVDNERWQGVPFYLESGKNLNDKRVEIEITFRPVLPCVCGQNEPHGHNNALAITIQPEQEIHLRFWSKKPGITFGLEPQDFAFTNKSGNHIDAYEKILYDCIMGDQTLFTSGDEVRAAWEFITPILKRWGSVPLMTYAVGSDGPESELKKELASQHTPS